MTYKNMNILKFAKIVYLLKSGVPLGVPLGKYISHLHISKEL